MGSATDTTSLCSAEGGDRLNLNQLVPVAQDCDPQQRARCIVVTKVPPHHFPDGEQVSRR